MANRFLICPRCPALVRVATDRVKDKPRCGKCQGPLSSEPVLAVDGPALDLSVGLSDVPVIVDFWAPWCAPCRGFAPVFAQQAEQEPGRALYLKLNTEEHQAVAGRYAIQSIPTLIAFRQGKEVRRQSGAMNGAQLHAWLEQL